jgi:hypothetical protein
MPSWSVSFVAFMLSILAAFSLYGAEYKTAEMTPPRSVHDVDSTLSNVSNQIRFYRGPVTKAIDGWRKSKGPFLRDGHLQFNFRTMDFQTRFADGASMSLTSGVKGRLKTNHCFCLEISRKPTSLWITNRTTAAGKGSGSGFDMPG